jgi:hypothetical protein
MATRLRPKKSKVYPPAELEGLLEQLRATEVEASRIRTLVNKAKRKTRVMCHACGRRYAVKNLVYIQTHWYEGPHGCTGGDRWHMDEGQFICPGCNTRNRLFERPEVEDLKRYFKRIEETHYDHYEQHEVDRRAGRTFVN